MLLHVLTIARNTFVESVRQPIYFILIGICALAILFTTWTSAFSMGYSDSAEVSGDNKMLLDVGLATVFVCGMLLAAFLATAVLSKEIERKTVLTVVSKPVSRASVVLGKYVGVAAAIAVAGVTMLLFLQMGIRHQVLSTAADELDMPVILFSLGAIVLSIGVATWGNFFYGWVFTQTATMLLFPLMLVAWVGVLLVSKEWALQPILTDFKPQIFIASVGVVMAHLVLTAVAVAASSRLGQVMTLVVCAGVFVGGLMSNYFLGKRAIDNEFVGRVAQAVPQSPSMEGLTNPGDIYKVTLEIEPRKSIRPGIIAYYGPNPSGWGLSEILPDVGAPEPIDVNVSEQVSDRSRPASIMVLNQTAKEVLLRRVGADDRSVPARTPAAGDYLFLQPTRVSPLALGLWGIIPNVQFFWLVDAVTQNADVPLNHLLLIMAYAVVQIGVYLSLAVALFQTREVG